MASSNPEKLMIKADKLTKLSLTRWSADWRSATLLYEQAAVGFKLAKDNVNAKTAFEKASKGQEMLSSPWDAAKHMESAGAVAKELGSWNEVADFYRRASELYNECGRSQPSSDALVKGVWYAHCFLPDFCRRASELYNECGRSQPSSDALVKGFCALAEASPNAFRMFSDACVMLEEDGKEQMAFDLYRAATSVYLQLERYADAATFLLSLGFAANQCQAVNSQCKAYLSALIVYLYANELHQAEKCYNDCSQIEAFLNSDQNRCASKLLSAYAEGDIEEIKQVAQSSTIRNLDHMIIRHANKLPTGDVSRLNAEANMEEPLDENDLT